MNVSGFFSKKGKKKRKIRKRYRKRLQLRNNTFVGDCTETLTYVGLFGPKPLPYIDVKRIESLFNVTLYKNTQYNTHNTIQYNTIQYNTVQYLRWISWSQTLSYFRFPGPQPFPIFDSLVPNPFLFSIPCPQPLPVWDSLVSNVCRIWR